MNEEKQEQQQEQEAPCLHEERECGHCNDCGEYVGLGWPEYEVNDER